MGGVIAIGDEIRFRDGSTAVIRGFDGRSGLYWTDHGYHFRHQFQPVKWLPATVTSTGIGVCAKGANGQ